MTDALPNRARYGIWLESLPDVRWGVYDATRSHPVMRDAVIVWFGDKAGAETWIEDQPTLPWPSSMREDRTK